MHFFGSPKPILNLTPSTNTLLGFSDPRFRSITVTRMKIGILICSVNHANGCSCSSVQPSIGKLSHFMAVLRWNRLYVYWNKDTFVIGTDLSLFEALTIAFSQYWQFYQFAIFAYFHFDLAVQYCQSQVSLLCISRYLFSIRSFHRCKKHTNGFKTKQNYAIGCLLQEMRCLRLVRGRQRTGSGAVAE